MKDKTLYSELFLFVYLNVNLYLNILIVECFFAKASTGAWGLEASPSSPGAPSPLHLKGPTPKRLVLAHTLKVANLPSYKKNYL